MGKQNNIDNLFREGLSGAQIAPQKPLTSAAIQKAAQSAPAGLGLFLFMHKKSILLASLAGIALLAGVLVWFLPSNSKAEESVFTEAYTGPHQECITPQTNVNPIDQCTTSESIAATVSATKKSVTETHPKQFFEEEKVAEQKAVIKSYETTSSSKTSTQAQEEVTLVSAETQNEEMENHPVVNNEETAFETPNITETKNATNTKAAAEPKQKKGTRKAKKTPNDHPQTFKGFCFGYNAQIELTEPVRTDNLNLDHSAATLFCGYHIGIEASYHFANYFGISTGLNFGTLSSISGRNNIHLHTDISQLQYFRQGLSLPVKFEFHYPITDRLWFMVDAGARLRMPRETFRHGYDKKIYGSEKGAFNIDALLDVGLYYQLKNNDFLRFAAGLNYATNHCYRGTISGLSFSLYNNFLALQFAYIHSFNKYKNANHSQPAIEMNNQKLYRHELKLDICDASAIMFINERLVPGQPHEYFNSYEQIASPVFSLSYHYRVAKWFWVGCMVNYIHYEDCLKGGGPISYFIRTIDEMAILPEIRFSYYNKPNVTLYSSLALGFNFVVHHKTQSRDNQYYWTNDEPIIPNTFSAFQLTAFGIKAGAKHWFGAFEIGCGYKGFANVGVGYEL